jgi:dihydroxy-acid dehydratase
MAKRRSEEEVKGKMAFKPEGRNRQVSKALKIYASLATSADLGAIRFLKEDDE